MTHIALFRDSAWLTSLTLLLSRMKKKLSEPRWFSILAPGMKGPGLRLIPNGLFALEVRKYGEGRHCRNLKLLLSASPGCRCISSMANNSSRSSRIESTMLLDLDNVNTNLLMSLSYCWHLFPCPQTRRRRPTCWSVSHSPRQVTRSTKIKEIIFNL